MYPLRAAVVARRDRRHRYRRGLDEGGEALQLVGSDQRLLERRLAGGRCEDDSVLLVARVAQNWKVGWPPFRPPN